MTDTPEPMTAYELLTKPTLELTDAEVERIVADLRIRRKAYVDSAGKKADNPAKEKAKPVSAEDKALNTARAEALLNLDLGL